MEAPQQLSREATDEFRDIYQKEFGENLSDDEAQEVAIRLLRLFDTLLRPSSSDFEV